MRQRAESHCRAGRAVLVNRYRATQAMTAHPAVLLVDDTWTTGGRAQSAAIALHDAGAARVAVVVLGRHFDRDFGPGETYYQQRTSSGRSAPPVRDN